MAVASDSQLHLLDTEQYASPRITVLEVLPGVTFLAAFASEEHGWADSNIQIGRSPPLSSNKAATLSHSPRSHRRLRPMLFFDDCNWTDHCTAVAKVVRSHDARATPHGMTEQEWEEGLRNMRGHTPRNDIRP